jgi:hypothetical protein
MAAACAAALAGAGCGGSKSDSQQVTDALNSYYKAAASGDGSTVCDLLSTQTKAQLEKQAGGKDCSTVVTSELARPAYRKVAPTLRTAKVTKVTVNGNNATATIRTKLPRPLSVPLTKEGGAWKIQAPLGG